MSSGWKLLIGIVIAALVIGIAVTAFHYLLGYGLLFLAAIGAIVLIRQLIVGRRPAARTIGRTPVKHKKVEARAQRELKEMEKRIRR